MGKEKPVNRFVIDNVRIIDGTGTVGKPGSVEVSDGRIICVRYGEAETPLAAERIDGGGLVLAPGFIDTHSHTDLFLGEYDLNAEKLEQGITTEICGQCGLGPAPVSAKHYTEYVEYYRTLGLPIYRNSDRFIGFGAYLDACEERPHGTNLAFFVPHGTLRIAAMGLSPKEPDLQELTLMKRLLSEAMEAGAMGMSTGLIYSPGSFAHFEELAGLAETIGSFGGIYTTHIRDEEDGVVRAVKEAIAIARHGSARLNVSHHKAMGQRNWGLIRKTAAMIRSSGLPSSFDIYPYTASSTTIWGMIPAALQGYGPKGLLQELDHPNVITILRNTPLDFEKMLIIGAPGASECEGKTVSEVARRLSLSDLEAFVWIIRETGMGAYISNFGISEEDICYLMNCSQCLFGTDGLYMPGMKYFHPRAVGSFPRILGRYVREKNVLPLEEAIHRMTGLAAEVYGLRERGMIREGFAADLVLFDPEYIADHADYSNPLERNEGIEKVWINGVLAVEQGRVTGHKGGKVLRKKDDRHFGTKEQKPGKRLEG